MSTKEEKIHKVLLELEVELQKAYEKHLKPRELVRGEETKLKLTVINIGEEVFPGASLARFKISEYGSSVGMASLGTSYTDETLSQLPVPRLGKGEKHLLVEHALTPTLDGLTVLQVSIKATDGGKVLHFLSPEGAGRDEWERTFYVVNRENLQLVCLMDKIAEGKKE